MSLLGLFLVILFSLTFFNGFFLLSNTNASVYKNRYLGITIMLYSLFFLTYVLWYQEKFILKSPFLIRTVNPLMFLTMPFFYFFVRNTLTGDNSLKKYDFLHFIPAIIHYVELIPFYSIPYQEKMRIAEAIVHQPYKLNELASGWLPGFWVDSTRLFLQILYFILSLRLLFSNKISMNWGREGINIRNWLFVAVILIGFILFSHIIYFIKEFFIQSGYRVNEYLSAISYLLVIIPIVALNIYLRVNQHLIYGYTIPEIFQQSPTIVEDKFELYESEQSHPNNSTTLEVEENLLDLNLQQLMNEEKIYLDKNLSLADIALKLNVSPRILSQYIKSKYNIGVREYINQFRIQAAINLMEKGYLIDKSLEGLCMTVGFNSRVTFFLSFKKFTGLNPTEFQRQQEGVKKYEN